MRPEWWDEPEEGEPVALAAVVAVWLVVVLQVWSLVAGMDARMNTGRDLWRPPAPVERGMHVEHGERE